MHLQLPLNHVVAFRTVFLPVAAGIFVALMSCKTASQSSEGSFVASLDPVVEPAANGVTLSQFGYETDTMALKELGSRVGCDEASRWITVPASGTMSKSIKKVQESESVYKTVAAEFFGSSRIGKACAVGGQPTRKKNTDGLKQLVGLVKKKFPGEGLTIIMIGGFGSHLGPTRALDDSFVEWSKLIAAEPTLPLRFWQIECTNSFAPDDRCAKDMLASLALREQNEPAPVKHHYLLWGFSKGGNTALEAMRQSAELREKTLALVTMGTPFGGSMTMMMLNPLVQKLAQSVTVVSNGASEFAKRLPLQYLLTPARYYIDQDGDPAKYAKLFSPQELPQIAAGSAAMLPLAKKEYLYNKVKATNFSRADGTAIPVFQGVALVDVANLHAVPLLTLKDGNLAWNNGSYISDHLAELGFSIMMKDFPLADTCVALQHAVLPMDAVPKGLKPELLAVMTFDHSSFRYMPLKGVTWDVPELAMVDALLATVATKLERGAL